MKEMGFQKKQSGLSISLWLSILKMRCLSTINSRVVLNQKMERFTVEKTGIKNLQDTVQSKTCKLAGIFICVQMLQVLKKYITVGKTISSSFDFWEQK